jgi:hypothetical protein
MSTADYVIDILLIAIIFRLVRPRELSPRAAVLPLVLLAAAGVIYLRLTSLGGNDLLLIVVLTVAGVLLGLLSGGADRIWFDGAGKLVNRATRWSILVWVAGMGFRFAFAYYAYHSGGPAIARFSASHHITGAQAWTTALFLMAAGQVIARVGLLQLRRINAISHAAASRPVPGHDHQGRVSRSPHIPDTL